MATPCECGESLRDGFCSECNPPHCEKHTDWEKSYCSESGEWFCDECSCIRATGYTNAQMGAIARARKAQPKDEGGNCERCGEALDDDLECRRCQTEVRYEMADSLRKDGF